MKFYRIQHNWSRTREVGIFPQIQKMYSLGDFDSLVNIFMALKNGPIENEWVIPEPILHNRAKPTTMINGGTISSLILLMFKDQFVDFLKCFKIGEFQAWPMKVHHKKEVLNEYLLFHLSNPSDGKYVDFENSEFFIGKQEIYEDQKIGKLVKIKNHQEYLNISEIIREEDKRLNIQCPKLVLDFENATEDIIRFAELPQAGYYVSERLRDAILSKRFTGMDFLEINEHDNRLFIKI